MNRTYLASRSAGGAPTQTYNVIPGSAGPTVTILPPRTDAPTENFFSRNKKPLIIGASALLLVGIVVMVTKSKKKRRPSMGKRRSRRRR